MLPPVCKMSGGMTDARSLAERIRLDSVSSGLPTDLCESVLPLVPAAITFNVSRQSSMTVRAVIANWQRLNIRKDGA